MFEGKYKQFSSRTTKLKFLIELSKHPHKVKILNTCNSNRDPGQLSRYHKVFKVKFILLKNQIATHCAIIMQLSSYNVGLDCTNREPPGNSSVRDTRGIRRSLSNGRGKCFKFFTRSTKLQFFV